MSDVRQVNARAVDPVRIGRLLRDARTRKGLTQLEAGKLARMARSVVTRSESGKHLLQLETLERVTSVYGITIASVFAEEGQV